MRRDVVAGLLMQGLVVMGMLGVAVAPVQGAEPKKGTVTRAELGGGVTLETVFIPPGEFLMGSTPVKGVVQRVNLRNEMKENRVKPAGEWNVYELRAEGPKLTLWVNGAVTTVLENLEVPKGYVGLEAEGYRIEFRNLKLKILP